jgi:hypothetical protein
MRCKEPGTGQGGRVHGPSSVGETRENMAGKLVKFIILSVICIVQTHAFVRSKTAEEGARAAACMIDCTMS